MVCAGTLPRRPVETFPSCGIGYAAVLSKPWRTATTGSETAPGLRHTLAKQVFNKLDGFVWWRLIRMLRERHRCSWGDIRRRFTTPTGRWLPIAADGVELFRVASVTVSRSRYRAGTVSSPWQPANPA
jgi:hypothetical protein